MGRRKLRKQIGHREVAKPPWSESEDLKHHLLNFDTFLQIDGATQCVYSIGNFTIDLQNGGRCFSASTVYMHLKEDSAKCFLCWEEVNEAKESEVNFSFGKCDVPYEVLTSLKSRSAFNLIINIKDSNSYHLSVDLFICPKLILPLSYASEPVSIWCRHAVQLVVKYFHGISFEDYQTGMVTSVPSIEELYSGIKNSFSSDVRSEEFVHPFLVPKLRQYQTQAVRWMINSEKQLEMEDDNRLHILYVELKTKNGYSIYYQKYAGIFVTSKFTASPSCKGGILADEMGMGKTVEVLACILLHPRPVSNNYAIANERDEPTDPAYYFECVCGNDCESKPKIKCHKCGLVQHSRCVLADPLSTFVNYICPYCWVDPSLKPVRSGATLIVSPASILFQWQQEIDRHLKKEELKVLIYEGIEHHKFINPEHLADYDIVLSSYETFRKEIVHVNLPYGENQRSLRQPRKFRALPSPLSAVEWWRICLDEAQMVESVTTKTAQMALELHSVNRWCVTGTPIQKSFEDLYGLLLFLGFNPYNTKIWWNELVSKPFINGNADTFNFVLNSVLWRTSKKSVLDQISIPEQETIVHYVNFSEIEKVYYESMHLKTERAFLATVEKYNCGDLKLRSMDKDLLIKVCLPMRTLQKACSHFQLTGGKFADIQRRKMTVPELLEFLLTKTYSETEEINRQLISSMNGLAGIYALLEDFERACGTYNKALVSIAESSLKNIRTDALQEIHTNYNYAEIVLEWVDISCERNFIMETLGVYDIPQFANNLKQRSIELSNAYLAKFSPAIQSCSVTIAKNCSEINDITSQLKQVNASSSLVSKWSIDMLMQLPKQEESNLICRVKTSLINAPGSNFLSGTASERFSDIKGLCYMLYTLSSDLHETRASLLTAVKLITTIEPCPEVIENASACHLRVIPGIRMPKCEFCKADDLFNQYESKLFRLAEVNTSDEESEESDTQVGVFRQLRKGTHSDGEFEVILKELVNYSRSFEIPTLHNILDECDFGIFPLKGQVPENDWLINLFTRLIQQFNCLLKIYTDDGLKELKLLDAMKKELKNLRATWLKMCEFVSAIDEVEMSKIRMRLLRPGERIPNPPLPYVILRHQLQLSLMQQESNISVNQQILKSKLGHLYYLQNLQKAKNGDGPLEEICPICRQTFENTWSVLQCGHSFCNICVRQLMQSAINSNTEIRCPVCREIISEADIYCVNNTPSIDPEMDFAIEGNFSAKISAVVKCLISIRSKDSTAKSLVFSHWPGLLEILSEALKLNGMKYLLLEDRKSLQNIGQGFKKHPTVNILLLPLNLGSNGLNIVEATHVLLIEPTMENSKILQAIGRVHRIGQTKKTFVHKFVLKGTLEENIYRLHDMEESKFLQSTVKDLVKLLQINKM